MTLTQIIRYCENKDSSSISYKQFNQTPKNQYPTFSLCFEGADIYWPHALKLFDEYGIASEQYDMIIKGGITTRYKDEPELKLYKKETIDVNIDISLVQTKT